MRVLVTGGRGFIGGHVVDRLLVEQHKPVVLERRQIQDHQWGVEYVFGDVRDETAIDAAVADCDGVIHCAGVLGTAETISHPIPSIDVNVLGSLNVFQAVRRYGVRCVNITVGNHWMNNSYSITKTTAERLGLMFNNEHGTRISTVRGLNAYGPRQKVRPVRKIMPNFIMPALRDEDILVYGDGQQVMDMIYVTDIADILVRALTVDYESQVPIISAGTGIRTTVNEIAETVIRVAGGGRILHVPMRGGEPEHSVVVGHPEDLGCLGVNASDLVALEDGVRETVKYYLSTTQ